MAMNEYTIRLSNITDVIVALECEAKRAKSEGFEHVEDRQNRLALHLRNAEKLMNAIVPNGQRVEATITFTVTPAVNPSLRPDLAPHVVRYAHND